MRDLVSPVAFLNARLDEDEARARRVQEVLDAGWNYFDETPAELIDPSRALREVEAKRAIASLHKTDGNPDDEWYGDNVRCTECGGYNLVAGYGAMGFSRPWPCRTFRSVLAIWSDHPGYDQAWKI